jgi:transposase InsO family protein
MPFAAHRRHQYWSVDIRYIKEHELETDKPVYVISILENFSRALLASAISPRQDLTAYLIVLRAAMETHGAPEALVSDGGGVFKANHAKAIYTALGMAHRQIDRGQAWPELHRDALQRHASHGRLSLRPSYHLDRAASGP